MLQVNSEMLRESLEKIVGTDDSTFSGIDLATLIRKKYGKSYDVQLIKKVSFLTSGITCSIKLSFDLHDEFELYRIRHFFLPHYYLLRYKGCYPELCWKLYFAVSSGKGLPMAEI